MPWLEDDAMVRQLMEVLPEPVNLMFYLANRSGLRLGEVCGLRLSDIDTIGAGAIRVRYSYNGPLKEDRHATGKVKWVPAPDDARVVLGPWLAARVAAGAGPEVYLFPDPNARHFRKEWIEYRWNRAAEKVGIAFTWYQATRHAMASRNLARGVPLDQVAAAMGHSTPAVTARHYAHFVRKTFAPLMTLGLAPNDAKVISIEAGRPSVSPSRPNQRDEVESHRPSDPAAARTARHAT
jgi:integrase